MTATFYYDQLALARFQDKAQRHSDALASALQLDIEKRLLVFKGFKQHVNNNITDIYTPLTQSTKNLIKTFIEPQLKNISGFKNFSVAQNGIQNWVYPETGNGAVIGHDLINDQRANVRAAIKRATRTRQLVLSAPYPLRQGGLGLFATQAIFKNDQFWGLVSMAIDLDYVMGSTEHTTKIDQVMVGVKTQDGQFFLGDINNFKPPITVSNITLPGQTWQLMIRPIKGVDAIIADDTLLFKLSFAAFLILLLVLIHTFLHHQNTLKRQIGLKTAEIKKSFDRFKIFSEISSDWFWEMDKDLKFSFFSDTFFASTGVTPEQRLGKTVQQSFSVDFDNQLWKDHLETLKNHLPFRQFVFPMKKNETTLWISVNGQPLFDNNGNFIGYQGTGTDVTERKNIDAIFDRTASEEKALGQLLRFSLDNLTLENYLQACIQQLLTSVSWLNLMPSGGIFISENTGDGDVLRLTAHHNLSSQLLTLCDRVEYGKCHCGRAALSKTIQYSNCVDDAHEITFDGIEQHGHYNVPIMAGNTVIGVIVFYLPHGHPKRSGCVAFLSRVADAISVGILRIRSQDKLKISEQKFRNLANIGNDWFWRTDAQHCFTEYIGYSEISDFPSTGITGVPRWENASEHDLLDHQKWQQHKSILYAHKPFRNFEFQLNTQDKQWISVSGDPVFDDQGQFTGHQGVAYFITERKQAEDRAKHALAEARQAASAKSEFLATMSHEFRTPLNAIIGFSDLIRSQFKGPIGNENYQEYINDIHNSGLHMLKLVNDVLDISAIEAGKRVVHIERFSIIDVVNLCIKNIETAADDHQITVSLHTRHDLPLISADQRSITQIFINLLSNSVKFTPPDGAIDVTITASGNDITIMVKDTGRGIAADQITTITEPFSQSNPDPHHAEEGAGLGLSIVKQLIDLHHGRLNIESQLDHGTTVTVTLPIKFMATESDAGIEIHDI